EGETRFAFGQQQGQPMPEETCVRYESFLRRADASVIPLVEVSRSAATRETRIMFRDDCCSSILPLIRKIMEDLGVTLNRAYWETYRGPTDRVEAVCSFYLDGDPGPEKLNTAVARLQALLALPASGLDALFLSGALSFDEFAFAVCAFVFVHHFIYKELETDIEIMKSLDRRDLRDALAKRVYDSNRSEYTRKVIEQAMSQNAPLVAELFRLFDRKFNPAHETRPTDDWMTRQIEEFRRKAAVAFMDDSTGGDIFSFMTRFVLHCHKTNFYRVRKRSFAFRLDSGVLDPSVYTARVHGIFLVAGFYAIGTHMRAEDISRGGLRLIRVTPGNYETELDNMPLLNYALGPVAQRLKHKDIAESGSKGVIVPGVAYARDGLRAVFDFTEGIMDLVQPADDIVDCLGKPEMVFFGPDEGTAPFMDAVAQRARERGYRHWRTITTGKSIGIPHDTYGLTLDRKVFGLISHAGKGTELQIEGEQVLLTTDTSRIVDQIGDKVDTSGMTTNGVMNALRAVLRELGLKEEETRLMMTGGPDGDLGANQIQSFKGRICLIIDGGSVLFDPNGLDRRELLKIAVARHTEPRLNSLAYPAEKLGPGGFKIPRAPGAFTLPGGSKVEDGAFFHRGFLCDPASRKLVAQANINAFVPCGGFKDTINARNVRAFLAVFSELKVIVEGANVFFDETARDIIARETPILQIKDSTANKGGVTSSSVAEVLP
ncbi:MAG TPA: NAD-glutamate dehydrogenase, partial [Candidatus Brocadiia bacterium]|nr:NAD-glutamate dehydrogenase [Candidatus Brocadiia bacterium]